MKTINKTLVAILSILCLVCMAIGIAACQDTVTYIVTYNLGEYNGEGVAPEAQTVDENTDITLPQIDVTWEGHEFVGWKNGNDFFDVGASYTVKSNVTFTAQWQETAVIPEPVEYMVTFSLGEYDGNGTAPVAKTVEENTAITLPNVGVLWKDHTFVGWSNGSDLLNAGASYTVTENVTFTALWKENALDYTHYSGYLGMYVGIHNGVKYVIEITETKIIVKIDGELTEVTFAFKLNNTGTYQFNLTINDKDYILYRSDEELDPLVKVSEIMLMDNDSVYFSLFRSNVESYHPWEHLIGIYKGKEILSGDTYFIEITDTDVMVSINGNPAEVALIDYNSTLGFVLLINGEDFLLMKATYAEKMLVLTTVDSSKMTMLEPAQQGDDDSDPNEGDGEKDNAHSPIFDVNYQGAWTGANLMGNDVYLVEIESDAIYVTVNDGERIRAWILSYDADDNVYFTLGNSFIEYELYAYDSDSLWLVDDSLSVYVGLERIKEGGNEEGEDEGDESSAIVFVGSYTLDGCQYVSFSFDLDKMELTYTYIVNGSEYTETASLRPLPGWSPSSGYVGTKADYTYYGIVSDSDSEIKTTFSFFVANDGSLMYLCDYTSDTIIVSYNLANAN